MCCTRGQFDDERASVWFRMHNAQCCEVVFLKVLLHSNTGAFESHLALEAQVCYKHVLSIRESIFPYCRPARVRELLISSTPSLSPELKI